MDRIPLKAEDRIILGKKVKNLRREGKLPAHVFGKGLETEHITVPKIDFLKVFKTAGETGLVDLKIGTDKTRPALIREVQYDPLSGDPVHIDFYQVNLAQKVTVPVPLVLIGEEAESVKLGETIVLQVLSEVEVEALPSDLVEKIEVDITPLKAIDDGITLSQLSYDHEKLVVHADPETVVVKLASAVSADTQQLLDEQAAETAAAAAETSGEEGEAKEGEEGEQVEGEAGEETAGGEEVKEEAKPEASEEK